MKTFINPIEPMSVEPIKAEYQLEAIEHIVEQLIKLHNVSEGKYQGFYNDEIQKAMQILNEGLSMIVKPYLVMKVNKDD
jgi:hypothetical protein